MADLFWPPRCPVCGREYDDGREWIRPEGGGRPLLHRSCFETLPRREGVDGGGSEGRVGVEWLYRDCPEFFRILHAVKYEGQWPLLHPLARDFGRWARERLTSLGPSVLVGLPDDAARLRARGDSVVQRLLVAAAAEGCPVTGVRLLRRRRSGPAQARMSSEARRLQNVRNLFGTGDLSQLSCRKAIVLVDDQVTTGATLRSALSVLAARRHRLHVLALAGARTSPRWVDP